MSKKPVILFGLGDVAQIVDFYFREDAAYDVRGFATTEAHLQSGAPREWLGRGVVPFEEVEQHYAPADYDLFVAVGYRELNRFRERIMREAKAKGYRLPSYLCSKSSHWGDTVIGENVLVLEDTLLQPFVTLEDGAFIGRGNSIGHHSTVRHCAFIANHAVLCGRNHIGVRSFVGSNVTINDGIRIAEDNLIGGHSLIKTHTAAGDAFASPQAAKLDPRAKALLQW